MASVCPLCSETFVSTRAFYAHIRPGNPDTVCLTTQELKDHGYERVITLGDKKGTPGRWSTWEEIHQDKWDVNREFWSCLFDPAMIFSDMFPLREFKLTTFEKFWGWLVKRRGVKKTNRKDSSS